MQTMDASLLLWVPPGLVLLYPWLILGKLWAGAVAFAVMQGALDPFHNVIAHLGLSLGVGFGPWLVHFAVAKIRRPPKTDDEI